MKLTNGFSKMLKLQVNPMSKDHIYGFARSVHERAEQIIEREILCNDSVFVSALMKTSFDGEFDFDHIENLFDESNDAIEEFLTDEARLPDCWNELDSDAQRKLGEEFGFSPLLKDIYEWWRVSKMLAFQLSEIDEAILKNDYGTWWGRTCSGQAIIMDGTIQKLLL